MNPLPLFPLTRTRRVVSMSDIHIGAEEHEEKAFHENLRWVKEEEALLQLNGDIIENSIADGGIAGEMLLGQDVNPTDQVKEAVSIFKPFAKKGRIVCMTRGNHEARTRRKSMLDLTEIIAHILGVPYMGIGGIVRFSTGNQVYKAAFHHGKSGARNIYLELDKMAAIYPAAELWALGHNHALDARTVQHIDIDSKGMEVVVERHQVRTGSYLGYADYAREGVMMPQPIGSPVFTFEKNKHQIDVDVKTLKWQSTIQ